MRIFLTKNFVEKNLLFSHGIFQRGFRYKKATRYGSTKDIETKKISCWTMSVMISSCMLNNPKRSIFDIILQTFLCVKLRLHRQLQLV